jgi:hypothetical protein
MMDRLGGKGGMGSLVDFVGLTEVILRWAGTIPWVLLRGKQEKRGKGEVVGRRLCAKWGMVEISGERAHGFVGDARSCSSVGSTYFMNFRAAPEPHGSLNGLSKVFPKRMSFAEYGTKNLP